MARGGWATDTHLWETLNTLMPQEALRFMGISLGESVWAERALHLAWHIVMRRSWSLAKHDIPPESLACLLASDEDLQRREATRLRDEHHNLLLLERAATREDDAAKLRGDLIFCDAPAVRLIFEFYKRDKYRHTSECGRNAAMAHVWTLAVL